MQIRVHHTDKAAARAVADRIGGALKDHPRLVLGLPTGRTSLPLYRELVTASRQGCIDFSHATTFNLDEFVGLASDDPGSFRHFMERHFFSHVQLQPSRIHFLNGRADDLDEECRRYEEAIQRTGGIDLQILGLGLNGHIGFNEPGPTLVVNTHVVELRSETRRANVALFDGQLSRVPRRAISMGIGTILKARSILLLATGERKREVVARMVEGPLTTELPASFLQVHADVEVALDEEAAGLLRR